MPLSDKGHLDLINEPFEDWVEVSLNNSEQVYLSVKSELSHQEQQH